MRHYDDEPFPLPLASECNGVLGSTTNNLERHIFAFCKQQRHFAAKPQKLRDCIHFQSTIRNSTRAAGNEAPKLLTLPVAGIHGKLEIRLHFRKELTP